MDRGPTLDAGSAAFSPTGRVAYLHRYLGERRRAGRSVLPDGHVPGRAEDVLRAAGDMFGERLPGITVGVRR